MIDQAATGKLPAKMFPETRLHALPRRGHRRRASCWRYDKGEIGEAYVLAGEQRTMGELIDQVGRDRRAASRRGFTMPALVHQGLGAARAAWSGPLMGFPPNLRELIRVSDGVTYWATDEKARRELGFEPARPRDRPASETLGRG